MTRYFIKMNRPSFLSGMCAAMDLGGTSFEFVRFASPEEVDFRETRWDWQAVGSDLRAAIQEYRSGQNGQQKQSETESPRSKA